MENLQRLISVQIKGVGSHAKTKFDLPIVRRTKHAVFTESVPSLGLVPGGSRLEQKNQIIGWSVHSGRRMNPGRNECEYNYFKVSSFKYKEGNIVQSKVLVALPHNGEV